MPKSSRFGKLVAVVVEPADVHLGLVAGTKLPAAVELLQRVGLCVDCVPGVVTIVAQVNGRSVGHQTPEVLQAFGGKALCRVDTAHARRQAFAGGRKPKRPVRQV